METQSCETAPSCRARLTICSVDRDLPPALRQHGGALDARSQHHGLGLGRHFLLLLAQDAGEHLPLRRGGASAGADGHAHLHLLHGAAGGGQNSQRRSKVKVSVASRSGSSVPLRSRHGLSLSAALRHVVVQHFVGLDEVLLHGRHLGHDLLPVEFGRLCFPFTLSFLFVLSTLK